MKAWWSDSLLFFAKSSVWVAMPVVVSLLAGKWLDRHFGTTPWILLTLTAFAFMISIFGIVKMTLDYLKKIEEEKKNGTGKPTDK